MLSLLLLLVPLALSTSVDVSVQIYPSVEEVSKATEYQITFDLKNSVVKGASIEIDFSTSAISVADGTLATCQYMPMGQAVVDYSGCSCLSSKCTVPVSETITNEIMKLSLGSMTNPSWVSSQTVKIKITYNENGKFSDTQASVSINSYSPASIVSATLTQSSYVVKMANEYTFALTTVNPVPASGRVRLTFPYEVSLDGTTSIYTSSGTLLTLVKLLNAKNQMTLTVTDHRPTGATKGTVITLRVQNVINPASMTTSSEGIQMQTLTKDDYLIDQTSTSTQLKSKSTESESITVIGEKLYPENAMIFKENKVFFRFQPKLSAESGTVLFKITLPSTVSLNPSSLSNSELQANPSAQMSYDSGTKIITISLFSCSSTNQQFLQISGIINPATTKQTTSFLLQMYEVSTNQLIQEYKGSSLYYTPLPGDLAVSTASRSSSVLGVDVAFSLEITPPHSFERGSFIYVYLPKSIVELKVSSSISCTKTVLGAVLALSSSECTIAELPSSSNSQMTLIVLKEWCTTSDSMTTCPGGTTLTFGLPTSFRNQHFTTSGDQTSLQIMVMTADKAYMSDSKTASIASSPVLVLNSVLSMAFTYLASTGSLFKCYAQQANSYSLVFKVNQYILDNNGQILLSLPKGALLQISSSSPPLVKLQSTTRTVTVLEHNSADPLEGVKSISLNQVCDLSACADNNNGLTILVSNFRNPLSSQPIDTSSLKYQVDIINLDGNGVDQSVLSALNSVTFTPDAFSSLSVSLSNLVVYHKASTLTVSFLNTLPFPPSNHPLYPSSLKVTIPPEVLLQQSSLCSIAATNGIQLSCAVSGQELTLSYSSSSATDYTKLDQQTLSLQVSNIINPPSTKPSSAFLVSLLTSNSYIYQTDVSKQVTMTTMGTLKSVSLTRSSDQPSQAINLTLSFSPNTPLKKSSFLQFDISLEQVHLSSQDTIDAQAILDSLQLFLIKDGSQTPTAFSVQSVDTNYLKILTSASQCPCPEDTGISYLLSAKASAKAVLKNPQFEGLFAPSCAVYSRDPENFPVDKLDSGIKITPSIAHGLMEVKSLASTNRVSSESTKLTATFKTFSNIQSSSKGRVVIQPAIYMYYQDKGKSALTCTAVGSATTGCFVKTTHELSDSTRPQYISSIILDLSDAQIAIINSDKSNVLVTVSGLNNYYLSWPSSENQKVDVSTTYETVTSEYSVIDQGHLTVSTLYPNAQATQTSLSIARSILFFGLPTSFTYQIQLSNLLVKDSQFYLNLHSNQFRSDPNNAAQCGFQSGLTFYQTTCSVSQSGDSLVFKFPLSSASYCTDSSSTSYCDYGSKLTLRVDGILNPASQVLGLINVLSVQIKGPSDSKLAGSAQISSDSFTQQLTQAPLVFSFSCFPVPWLLLLFLLLLFTIYILVSVRQAKKQNRPYETAHAVLGLFGLVQQLFRLCLVTALFQNSYSALLVMAGVPLSASFILAYMMVQYYIKLFHANIPKYSALVESHPKFYRFILYSSYVLGPKTLKLLQCGMIRMPFLLMEQIVVYQQTLNRTLILSFLFSLWAVVFDIVILAMLTVFEYAFHFAYSDLVITLCLETLFLFRMLRLRNTQLKYQSLAKQAV